MGKSRGLREGALRNLFLFHTELVRSGRFGSFSKRLTLGRMLLKKEIPNSSHSLIIDGDDHTVWCYVINENEEIMQDGFLCSCGPVLESMEELHALIERGSQPALTKEFENEYSIQEGLTTDSLNFDFNDATITVYIRDIAYLIMDINSKRSYSKAVNREGPYGFPM